MQTDTIEGNDPVFLDVAWPLLFYSPFNTKLLKVSVAPITLDLGQVWNSATLSILPTIHSYSL